MSIDQVMRRPVQTLPPEATCAECAKLMREQAIGAVVVEQDGAPLGVVTDRDLVVRVMAEQRNPTTVKLRDVMSRYPAFLSSRRTLDEAVTTMRDLGVRRLPIVDEAGRLAGMLSMDDVLMLIARQIGEVGEAIRTELTPR
jgi:CBS domain-containing protein